MAGYIELHAHSCWSLREGASSTDEMVTQGLALEYEALALTDHDNLYGAMEFAQGAKSRGLRPITGCELTLAPGDGTATSHLTVLAATVDGYRNLCRLLSAAYKTHGKDSPLVEEDWLWEHHEGLIVLSGCREGALSRLAADGSRESREAMLRLASHYREVFGDRYYIELQHNDVFGDQQRCEALWELGQALGIEAVATGNAHYHERERHRLNDVLVAVRHRLTLDSSHTVRRPNSEFYLRSADEMERRFAKFPGAVARAVEVAQRCVFDLTRDLPYRLPDYPDVPEGSSNDDFLRGICERAFGRRYSMLEPGVREEARQRLERELQLIQKHGLAGFFLVYWQILKLVGEIAQELHGRDPRLQPDERPVGRGRGSSVSSVVCYLIGLSHIDPVQNDLYLERFLNEELHSLPDIDLDFPRDIRDELLRRVYTHFGEEHAALVAAFPTYRMRAAAQDIGKALGLPAPTLAKLSKLGDAFASAHDLERQMEQIPELQSLARSQAWRQLAELSHEIAGFPRHISQHVGGVVISAEKLSSVVPLEPARMEGRYVCQWDKDSVDDGRLVKIDFLALGMLSAVDDCLDMIEETRGTRVDLGRIDHASDEIYASIQAGDTMGVFQIESRAQIQTLPRTRPRTLDDLAVQVAIIRPGPIMAGAFRPYMEYREKLARGEPVDVDYGHPELKPLVEPFMAETLGHVLYQDQVLQVACAVAGFSPGQADQLRRAMSRKRSTEAMQALADMFYEGAARQKVSREAAEVAFERIAAFAAFGFPKSHAVAFALLAYESCWLRYHYPAEYYSALFNSQPMGFYSIEVLTGDVRRHGVDVLMPDINLSRAETWPEDDAIRLGLNQVQGLGGGWFANRGRNARETLPARIVREREAQGQYRSLFDVVQRAQLKRDEAEALIKAGALRDFGMERRELLWQLGLLFPGRRVREGTNTAFQPSLPLPTGQDMVRLPSLRPWEEVAWDYAATGVTERKHPMALVRPLLHEGLVTSRHIGGIGNPNRLPQGMPVEMAGMVVTRQRPQTASGVLFMLLEDEFGLVNLVVWSAVQERQRELVRGKAFVIVRGRIDNEKSGFPNIIVDEFAECPMPGLLEAPQSHDYG